MKTSNIIWLFVLVLLLAVSLFFFFGETAGKPNSVVGDRLNCQSDKIGGEILSLGPDVVALNAFVTFSQLPLTVDQQAELDDLRVIFDPGTEVFNNIWGSIPVDSLCDLAAKEYITKIFAVAQNN